MSARKTRGGVGLHAAEDVLAGRGDEREPGVTESFGHELGVHAVGDEQGPAAWEAGSPHVGAGAPGVEALAGVAVAFVIEDLRGGRRVRSGSPSRVR